MEERKAYGDRVYSHPGLFRSRVTLTFDLLRPNVDTFHALVPWTNACADLQRNRSFVFKISCSQHW